MSNTDKNPIGREETGPDSAKKSGTYDEDINSFLDDLSGNSADDFLEQLYTDSFKDLNTDFDTLLRSFQSIDPDDPTAEQPAAQPQAVQAEPEPEPDKPEEPEMEDIFSYSDHTAVNTRSHKKFSDSVQQAMEAEEAAIARAQEPQDGDTFRLSLDRIDGSDMGLGEAVEEAASESAGSTRVFSADTVRSAAARQPARRAQNTPVQPRQPRSAAPQNRQQHPAAQGERRRSPAQPPKTNKRHFLLPTKNDSVFEIFRKVLFLVSTVVVVVCLVIIGNTYLLQPYLEKGRQAKIDDLMQGSVSDADSFKAAFGNKELPTGARYNLAQFYATNSDFYGYLEIPGTSISTPVVQGKDNKEYLHKNFFGESTKYGCPFVNYQNTYAALDYNTSIFGHNMEYDDLVFGDLENYRTIKGFKQAPLMHLETMYADYYFKVYAVFLTDSAYDSSGWYFDYIFTQLKDEAECREYIAELDARKLYSTGVDIKPSDKLLTLSTCAYDFSTERLVVVGRLVRDGESNDVDVSKAVANNNPRYPDKYYQKKGKSNPYATAAKWIPNA